MAAEVQRHVLLVGVQRSAVEHLVPLLQREEIEVISVDADPAVVEITRITPFELVMLRFPAEGVDTAAFLEVLRDQASASRRAGVLLLADEAHLEGAASFLDHGANRVVSATWSDARIWRAVADLLDVAPRVALRVPVMVDVNLATEGVPEVCRSVDLSTSGIRLECPNGYPPGTRLQIGLVLPKVGGVVRVQAEVVRRTDPERESVVGFAARFTSMGEEDEERLARFLDLTRRELEEG